MAERAFCSRCFFNIRLFRFQAIGNNYSHTVIWVSFPFGSIYPTKPKAISATFQLLLNKAPSQSMLFSINRWKLYNDSFEPCCDDSTNRLVQHLCRLADNLSKRESYNVLYGPLKGLTFQLSKHIWYTDVPKNTLQHTRNLGESIANIIPKIWRRYISA